MSAARRALRGVQRLLPAARGPGATVLCYHLVGAGTASAVDLPVERFAAQMEELAGRAEVVPLAEAVRRMAAAGRRAPADLGSPDLGRTDLGGTTQTSLDPASPDQGSPAQQSPDQQSPARQSPARRPLAVLTFDDAYANFATVAWPILERLGLPATLFVPVGFVDGECPPPNSAAPLPPASWEELRAMTATGLLTPGSHTWSHPDLTKLPAAAVRGELVRSRERLEERLGVPVTSFCYPRGLWSPAVERKVGRVYELAAIGGGGRLAPGRVRPLRIERISLRRDAPPSLAPLLTARVWLEERVADYVRRWRG